MSLAVYAEVDTNDGDYVGDLKALTSEEVERLEELVHRSGDSLASWTEGECQERSNHLVYPCFNDEELAFISECLPNPEYGFHTVETIKIVNILNTL
ncbi:hypothetical protein MYOV011v1_p0139 [Vibrio phage 6E35.1a]|nr:hypothetical protein MYOV011v1_p0139 [Vibrio phage 6E35.1a]